MKKINITFNCRGKTKLLIKLINNLLTKNITINYNLSTLNSSVLFQKKNKTLLISSIFLLLFLVINFNLSSYAQSSAIKDLYLSDPSQALDRIDPVASVDNTISSTEPLSAFPDGVEIANSFTAFAATTPTATFTVSSVTVLDGYNRIMLVGISQRNRTISSVKYNGINLTLVGQNTSNSYARMHLYALVNPPVGTADVVVTLNGTVSYGIVVGVTNFTGVNQSTPFGTFNSAAGRTNSSSVTVSSTAGELVYDVCTFRNTSLSAKAGQTQVYNIASGSEMISGASTKPGAASVTVGWNGGSSQYWANGAVSIKPAAAITNTTFTQSPVMCNPITIAAGTPIVITNYVSIISGAMPVNPTITAQLKYGATNIITINNPVYSSGMLTWTGSLGSTITVPAGQAIALLVTTTQAGVKFSIDYDSQTNPSKVSFPAVNYIDILSYSVYDAPYPGGSIVTSVPKGTTVYLRATVTDPFGYNDITGMDVNITPPGMIVLANSVATSGCNRTYEYVWDTPNIAGDYFIPATAKEGLENTVTDVQPLTFNLCEPITTPVFDLGSTSSRCQGMETITYSADSDYATGITYSLDAASVAAGNTINILTGEVTYVSGWTGISEITAIASGCGGPKSAIHTVTIIPTVGIAVFDNGLISKRCKGEGYVIYSATATNTTGITYSLDAISLAAGNTINPLTGQVDYVEGWSGNTIITASAEGCNGPVLSTHIATTNAILAVDDNVNTIEGEPITINLTANDECDIDASTVSIVVQPANGDIQMGTNGSVIYLPNGTYSGSDVFTYQVCTGGSPTICSEATVYVTIQALSDDPCLEATHSKTFYLPFPENTNSLRKALWSAANVSNLTNDVRSVLSIKMAYPNTIIVYDQWEDGYESDITTPVQITTQIWGDGDLYNGVAPGYASDLIPAGGYIYIDNQFVYNPRNPLEIVYDGKDKMYSSNDIAVSKVVGDAGGTTFMVQNAKTNVVDITRFGKYFVIPFGENTTMGGTGAFKYTSIFIRAAKDETLVNLDYNGDGNVDATQTLNEGEVWMYDGTASTPGSDPADVNKANDIKSGAVITSNYPVGVDMLFGGIDNYGTRNLALLPSKFYGNVYYTPVHTTLGSSPVYVFFTNPLTTPITVNWTAGTLPTPTTGSLIIPGKGANYLSLSLSAGYKFESVGGESFTAASVIDADAAGSTYDWSFNLIPDRRLTNFTGIAWAPGSNNGSGNYNPVWVTALSATTLYIKYDGNLTDVTPTMSPCGIAYDIAVSISALQSYKIFDTDKDQTGMSIYTCDGTKFFAVWGQDPNAGSPTPTSSPAIDVGYVMEPRCMQMLVIANDDYKTTDPNVPIIVDVLSNDAGFLCNVDPTSVSISGLMQPLNGSIVVNGNGTITYTPNIGFQGIDRFQYRVCSIDYHGICDIATVTIQINGCTALDYENLIKGKVFVEQLPDDGQYNDETGAAGIRVNLYTDVNCNGVVDANEGITKTTISDLSGNYEFSTMNNTNSMDNFDPTASFSGNDGGLNWTNSWSEVADNGVINTGDVRIMMDATVGGLGNAIRLSGSNNGITRTMTFSDAISSKLKFYYRRQSLDNQGEEVSVTVNGNLVYTIPDGGAAGTDVNYTIVEVNISSFDADGNNIVRFLTNASTSTDDYIWIDNVELIYYKLQTCYIVKVDPSGTGGSYMASSLNTQISNLGGVGNCDIYNNLGVLVNLIASNDNETTSTNIPVVINVIANDVVGIPDPATVTTSYPGLTEPTHGTVVVNADGTITYIPLTGYDGPDVFQYRVCHLEDPGVCSIAKVNVLVSCISIANQNTMTGRVFNDVNGNGFIDAGEGGLESVNVNLYEDINSDGALDGGDLLLDTKTTTALGVYQFDITPPSNLYTFIDLFNSNGSASGSNGSVTWTEQWTKIGDLGTFAENNIQVTTNRLRLQGNGTTTVLGAYRSADFSNAISATLSFNFIETGLDLEVGDYVDVEIATSSTPAEWTLLERFTGANGNESGSRTFDVTDYMSSATTIRFVTSGDALMSTSNIIYFDNIQFSFNRCLLPNTVLDQFNTNGSGSGNNGTVNWSNNWTEILENNGLATASVYVTGNVLRVCGNSTTNIIGTYRSANLENAISAVLTFNYVKTGLDNTNDYVRAEVSSNGEAGPWTTLATYTTPNASGTASFDISDYISTNTTIRFVTSGYSTMISTDYVTFDNVQIRYFAPIINKYIVQLAQPILTGYTLTSPLPSPTGIHTASFACSDNGDCQNDFGLTAADLSISKICTTNPVYTGEQIRYTLSVNNAGPCNANNVIITDEIPSSINNVEYSFDGNIWNSWTGFYNIGSLNRGNNLTIYLKGTVGEAVCSSITNIASVSSSTGDPNTVNNNSTVISNVIDNIIPVITTSAGSMDRTLECSDLVELEAALALLPVATDNCTINPTIHLLSDIITEGSCEYNYTRVRIWNFTDEANNTSSSFSQTITVSDETAPVITNCGTTSVIYVNGLCSSTLPDLRSELEVTDNCSSVNIIQDPPAGTEVGIGSNIEVSFTVSDVCGNTNNCSITIEVKDNTDPTITCNSDLLECATEGLNGAIIDNIDAIYTDNCPGTVLTYDLTGATIAHGTGQASGLLFNTGVTLVTYTLTDASGNHNECSFNVTVFPRPTSVLSGTTIICNGGTVNLTVTLTGTQPFNLTYTDGTTPVTINNITSSPVIIPVTPLSNKTYTIIELTDDNCNAIEADMTGTAEITLTPGPSSILTGSDSICKGDTTGIIVELTGNKPWTITYSDGTTPVTIDSIYNTPYIIKVAPEITSTYKIIALIDSTCVAREEDMVGTSTITVFESLKAEISGGSHTTCFNTSPGTFTVTATGAAGEYIYQWYTNKGLIEGATNSTYTAEKLKENTDFYCLVSSIPCGTVSSPISAVVIFCGGTPGVWTGCVSTLWEEGDNWADGNVPVSNINVFIPATAHRQPVINNSIIGYCNNINIGSGASLTLTEQGILIALGTMNIDGSPSGALYNSGKVNLGGNLNNAGLSNLGIGEIIFKGNINQNVYGTNIFGGVTFDKTNGNITNNGLMTVTGQMKFIKGVLNTTTENILTLSSSATVYNSAPDNCGANDFSYVDGPMIKEGNTDFIFPVGKSTAKFPLHPIGITLNNNNDVTFLAEYFNERPPNSTLKDTNVARVTASEWWNLHKISGDNKAKVTLRWRQIVLPNPEDLIVVHFYEGLWRNEGQEEITGIGGVDSYGTITSREINNFSPFTYGTTEDEGWNPLPIELLSFNAISLKNKIELKWTTATEINNDYFTLEKSTDAVNFTTIATVKGAGNSNKVLNYQHFDENPIIGINYYRLKQTDFDGAFKYTQIISALYTNTVKTDAAILSVNSIYNNSLFTSFFIPEAGNYTLDIYDITGKLLSTQAGFAEAGITNTTQNINKSSSVIIVVLNYNNKAISKKYIINK